MKSIERRISALESKSMESEQAIEAQMHREFLSKLTNGELHRLEAACIRTREWKLPLTDEEAEFLDMLDMRVLTGFNYGLLRHGY